MAQILCIEDSEDTILILVKALNGHNLTFARSIQEAQRALEKESYSLLLVDIGLPDGSGLEFLAEHTDLARKLPVLILTGKQDFASKVLGFSLGCDDFIIKPFDPRELLLRVETRLKKNILGDHDDTFRTIGDLIYSTQEQRLRKQSDGAIIELTSLEFRIFHLLAKAPNKIFSREEILNRVWTDHVSVIDRTVDVHISNLRRKIANSIVTIDTVIGSGYRISSHEKKDVNSEGGSNFTL